ncbi:GrpB-like predicted nucleotidyltransferase (UPF0157 family) [Paenibacillus shirakamiensis]|uniref:GrpB-like predicted nucleotidyltransferase (UPF0157 family) n=1 Tax=Paenibacillus shirakamiensis TaxID=1265935 RepID=A0ABS4JIM9_9BACL|nr:GrpB family protein [Paenibacillus shirakamiensis]MBP2001558.1 GrpB-like predicted nucleotidyltransferase (UPF0157 family) [Paenibacillus shirakamiensis]
MAESTHPSNWPLWAVEAVHISPSNPAWLTQGSIEQAALAPLLSPFGMTRIEHIGSTSVSGLPAKPIIDLMAQISSFEHIEAISEQLAPFDWHYVPPELDEREWRRFFVKVHEDQRIAHLHLMLEGEERWEKQLTFRNRLRANPQLTEQYAELKLQLAATFADDREAYTLAKTQFIEQVLAQKQE